MENPYAPPQASATEPTAQGAAGARQYTPNQVAGATFLGTLLAGALLLAANDRATGHASRAVQTLSLGVLATVVTLGVALILPANFPGFIIPLATTLAARAIAQLRLQQYLSRAPAPPAHSNWRAAGIGVACMLGAVGFFVAAGFVWPELFVE